MDLLEYEGRAIFAAANIPVLPGTVIRQLSDLDSFVAQEGKEYVLKAQVRIGGRGKAGGIRFATAQDLHDTCKAMLGMDLKGFTVREIMLVEKAHIDQEHYLSLLLNRSDRCITLLYTQDGGMDIERIASETPEKVLKVHLQDWDQSSIVEAFKHQRHGPQLTDIALKMLRIMQEKDALLVEINPLALSKGRFIAIDAKVSIDENALYRHPEYVKEQQSTQSPIEQKAAAYELEYVELDGDIAIIGNGAGLVMATLDVVQHFGGKPANFLDIGGGASVEKMEQALEIVLMKKGVKGVFINIFGGITRCDEIATGLVNHRAREGLPVPLVVRMTGTNDVAGKKILLDAHIESKDSMEECARSICALTK